MKKVGAKARTCEMPVFRRERQNGEVSKMPGKGKSPYILLLSGNTFAASKS